MTLISLIIQVLLTIPLTIILNYCKNKNNRKIDLILIPTIYMIIMTALIPSIKENAYLIVVFEIFIRNFYIINITMDNKENPLTFIMDSILSVALSVFTYSYFISNVETVIPNSEDIKAIIWFMIVVYIMSLYKTNSKDIEQKKKEKNILIKKEYIIMQYAKYKNKYSDIIKSKNNIINNLIYSLMIYESGKTPVISRKIEEYIGAVTKTEKRYGIMRVKSYNHISDEESIIQVINKLEKQARNKDKIKLEQLLTDYNEEEINIIISIYNEIVDFSKK